MGTKVHVPLPLLSAACLLLFSAALPSVTAVIPHLKLEIRVKNELHSTMLVSNAFFGNIPGMDPAQEPLLSIETTPQSNFLMCEEPKADQDRSLDPHTLLLIPRGICTFETKVRHAQQMGAQAALIYNTLESRYSLNETAANVTGEYEYTIDDIVYPREKFDYDCQNGHAWIDSSAIVLDDPLPYNSQRNDPVLSGDSSSNLCRENDANRLQTCVSRSCLLTGTNRPSTATSSGNDIQYEACCAWDLHIFLYPDTTNANDPPTIPSAFLSMTQAQTLMEYMSVQSSDLQVVLYQRWRPTIDLSAPIIWMLGIFAACLASYLSASDYHFKIHKLLQRRHDTTVRRSSSQSSGPPPRPALQEENMELMPIHALFFVVMASTSLLVLFYFKIYGIVKVFYAIGCSSAVAQVLLEPLLAHGMRIMGKRNYVVTTNEELGDITLRDIVAFGLGFALGFSWLCLAFFKRKPEDVTFFWVMQDVFGACMCIAFLKVIRLNSIKVASILLIVAFFYDIFFVFITPYLFEGKSVMITVATSGGPPKADELWCEKYPDDKDCQGGNPLPMLLAIPKVFDYAGGSSLLGLGDIVLPGLLLSFAARLDAAKALVGIVGGGRGAATPNCPQQQLCCSKAGLCCGYFPSICVAYAVGLAMANTAVYVFHMGQPALLYLVPCCLGTMVFIGWRRNELEQIWEGPRILERADEIVFGTQQQHHAPLPSDEGDEGAVQVPSAVDTTDDEDCAIEAVDARR